VQQIDRLERHRGFVAGAYPSRLRRQVIVL
jgi:hypothetical protein